jgi:hypothetical protein
VVETLPLLGSGKVDYPAALRLLEQTASVSARGFRS